MNCVVVGYGSIGIRHARILAEMGHRVTVVSRRRQTEVNAVETLADALLERNVSYVVVANETTAHLGTLNELCRLGFSGTVLVEKPLLAEPERLPDHRFARLAVGYNLRFHPVLRRLRELVADQRIVAVDATVGSYLPSWRPGRDYRTTASASQKAGGGALLDLSHELDALSWLLGPCRALTALGGHYSALEIDTDDVFMLLARFERCAAVSIHLDLIDRIGRRVMIVNTETDTIVADLVGGSIRHAGGIESLVVERDEMYRAQHLAVIGEGGNWSLDTCDESGGLAVVSMIAAARQAAKNSVWVAL